MKPKEEISRSTSPLDSLVVEVLESRPFSSDFVWLALVVRPSAIGGTSVLVFLQPFFLVTVRPTVAHSRSEPKVLLDAEPVGSTRFSPLRLLRARNFLAFTSRLLAVCFSLEGRLSLKGNRTRHGCAFFPIRLPPYRPFAFTMTKHSSKWPSEKKPAASRLDAWDERTRSRKVRVHKLNITPQFPLHVATGGKFYLEVSTPWGAIRFAKYFIYLSLLNLNSKKIYFSRFS